MLGAEREELEAEVSRMKAEERAAAQQRLRAAQSETQELRRKLEDMAARRVHIGQM